MTFKSSKERNFYTWLPIAHQKFHHYSLSITKSTLLPIDVKYSLPVFEVSDSEQNLSLRKVLMPLLQLLFHERKNTSSIW